MEKKFEIDSNLEHALLIGNLVPNLVSRYKYEPKRASFKSDKERLFYYLQIYNFYTLELTLYLACNPTSDDVVKLLKEANLERDKIKKYIAEKYSLCKNTNPPERYFTLDLPWSDCNVGV